MSVLQRHALLKEEVERINAEIDTIEAGDEFESESKFRDKLVKLQEDYGKTAKQTAAFLVEFDPSLAGQTSSSEKPRRQRPMLTYTNPHSGEIVKTKGGNHVTLKAWRKQYGKEAVASWRE